jgi:hypothetical protein
MSVHPAQQARTTQLKPTFITKIFEFTGKNGMHRENRHTQELNVS